MDVVATHKNLGAAVANNPALAGPPNQVNLGAGDGPHGAQPPPAPDPAANPATAPVGSANGPDGTLARIFNLIPSEVIVCYTALIAIVSANTNDGTARYANVAAIAIGVGLICYVLQKQGAAHSPPIKPMPAQFVFSILAFLVWTVSTHDPCRDFGHPLPAWVPGFGVIVVPLVGSVVLGSSNNKA